MEALDDAVRFRMIGPDTQMLEGEAPRQIPELRTRELRAIIGHELRRRPRALQRRLEDEPVLWKYQLSAIRRYVRSVCHRSFGHVVFGAASADFEGVVASALTRQNARYVIGSAR
jgi:hypothetical protein